MFSALHALLLVLLSLLGAALAPRLHRHRIKLRGQPDAPVPSAAYGPLLFLSHPFDLQKPWTLAQQLLMNTHELTYPAQVGNDVWRWSSGPSCTVESMLDAAS